MNLQGFLSKYNINDLCDLVSCIKRERGGLPVDYVYQAAEFLNPNRDQTAAYYTDTIFCQKIIDELPIFANKEHIKILEPSVGAGKFIPFIAEKYKNKSLELYLVDIDESELKIAELIFETYHRERYPNISVFYICGDYLKLNLDEYEFDLIIGNPPYAKVTDTVLLREYKKRSKITKSKNTFVWFLEKAAHESEWVSFVVPKSVLNAPEYEEIRSLLSNLHISSILDFGENGFRGVKIETINILFSTQACPSITHIVSFTQDIVLEQRQEYITDSAYPTWLIYRNKDFDDTANKMRLGVFDVFRDRQIVNSMLSSDGKYRVLKSRNIGTNEIIDVNGYDSYISEIDNLAVVKFLNRINVILVPNLSYYPRACFLPNNMIANGSVALLTLKDENEEINDTDLAFFSTEEFRMYYRIARNFGTRSLNIDSNSVYFFGIRREK